MPTIRGSVALLTIVASFPAAAKPAPVKLGLLLDPTSLHADVGGRGKETFARMAVEDFGGTLLGRSIEVVAADHGTKADAASNLARHWFDVDGMTAIMDVTGSATARAVMRVAKDKDRIVMLNGPGAASITNENCIPTGVRYAYDTYALAHSTAQAVTRAGGSGWSFLTADHRSGDELARESTAVSQTDGGTVLGNVEIPANTADFSAYLLQAQTPGAKVVGFARGGGDAVNSVKQAAEFGLPQGGQTMAGLLVHINDVNSMGLDATHGTMLTSGFYWDRTDASRAFAKRWFARMQRMPNVPHAGVHSATLHYLQAARTAGTTDAAPVMKAMRDAPIDDAFVTGAHIRADGLMTHDMSLFEVKKPDESRAPWECYTLRATIPADEAFMPLSASKCPLVGK